MSTEEEPIPAMFLHSLDLYTELQKRAGDSDMFVGSKVDAFRSLKLGPGYYSRVYNYLIDLGCVVSVQRGHSRLPSMVQLVKPPELAEFRELVASKPLTKLNSVANLQAEIDSLKRRLPEGIDWLTWIDQIETRLADLEAAVHRMEIEGG